MSGDSTYEALVSAVQWAKEKAPPDHDLLAEASGVLVTHVKFDQAHSFVFLGFNEDGNAACVVAHFSRVVTKVIFRPKQGPERVITGFAKV